ncbi:flagellar type III secretion system pore protein FliP [Thermosulfuriphilus ammonigenes]|uniref:Flagellar biosynthetic protein FliP n=1 Tax=Thermosulfuriphilus ammonigenes TaxID=1936021 RepID=A0A6G7PYF6_9BACT|nr:flagellar type III secretion system pore protein FliP [Thermosulfuriphilus ammonigenes]MBA2849802.1 flagellar biosynthetic protein FliP [Thermosulfuriphilus ammonigenes]QIJ72650.1 flagellar type III secretion system pore protein FliP [Thermosulfuriphilus ammonigenes]
MKARVWLTGVFLFLLWPQMAGAVTVPFIKIGLEGAKDPRQVSILLEILFLLTILSLAPSILLMMTSFTRLVVVFSFLRHAIGTQQMPPNQVLIGLALFLTFFIMAPVWQQVNNQAIKPYLAGQMAPDEALKAAANPVREFMFRQTREKDLAIFIKISGLKRPYNKNDVPTLVLIPAFMISELKTAFQIGFILYVPFLIIDMVVASVLLSMGMMMLPPVMISLPFKLLLFVLVDGWHLLVGSLIESFRL